MIVIAVARKRSSVKHELDPAVPSACPLRYVPFIRDRTTEEDVGTISGTGVASPWRSGLLTHMHAVWPALHDLRVVTTSEEAERHAVMR